MGRDHSKYMFEFVLNGFYLYPAAHVLLPSIMFLFGAGGFRSATLVLSLCALWELVEFLLYHGLGTYVLFFDGNLEQETEGNSIFLDLTHALVGITFAWLQVRAQWAVVFQTFGWRDCAIACGVGLAFAFFSGFSWGCNTITSPADCTGFEALPWGNIACWCTIVLYAYLVIARHTNGRTAWMVAGNTTLIIGLTTIKLHSSAIMAYIAGGVLVVASALLPQPSYSPLRGQAH